MHKIRITMVCLMTATFLMVGGINNKAHALLAQHDCSFCHISHGAPGFSLLNKTDVEVLCLSCHATANGSTDAAAVHNPAGVLSTEDGYITCRECHDPHDNYVNANGNPNIKLIGIRYDPATGQRFSSAVIREELPGGSGPYRSVIFEDRTDFNIDGSYPGPGACQICHTPRHNQGNACTDCHGGGGTQHDHALGFE
ncbi:MAG: cytochrome c3 family protein [Desulfuromonadales bacterium]|nr:cytochrome c3 family protein [Desulfuromonadales bacterium]